MCIFLYSLIKQLIIIIEKEIILKTIDCIIDGNWNNSFHTIRNKYGFCSLCQSSIISDNFYQHFVYISFYLSLLILIFLITDYK